MIIEKTLSDVLTKARVKDLPKPYIEGAGFWMEAIALVRKRDVSESYCLVSRKADGQIVYTYDPGHLSPIAGLLRLFPYVYLDEAQFCSYKDSDLRSFLDELHPGEADAIMAMSSSERAVYVREVGMYRQQRLMATGDFIPSDYRDTSALEAAEELQRELDSADEVGTDDMGLKEGLTNIGTVGKTELKPKRVKKLNGGKKKKQ